MALIGATLMAVLIVFQAALALGAPWGRAAWGGQHPGTLPRHLRMASAANILVFGFAIWALLAKGSPLWLLWALTGFFALGFLINLISRSRVERMLWTPVAAGICAAFLLKALG